MNPLDFILLFVSIAVALMSIMIQGWTLHGIGPAILSLAAGIWQFWMQWLRDQSSLRRQHSGFAPGTQHLAMSAAIGWIVGMVGAMIWVLVTRIPR